MTRFALTNGQILTDDGFRDDLAVIIGGAHIEAVVPAHDLEPGLKVRDLEGQYLMPGFIDIQVNGGGGVLFNDEPTVEGIAAIGAAHRTYGTTGFLTTLISDRLEVVEAGMQATKSAIDAGVPGVLGIHVEGPFLNADKKGIHNASLFRPLDDEAYAILSLKTGGQTLVTAAPEANPLPIVRKLADAGVLVVAGHTDASFDQAQAGFDAGMCGVTHLFNAMSPLKAREPGMVGAALINDQIWCPVIVDGHHVHPATLKLALKLKPRGRLFLVTDAMPSVGLEADHFVLQGRKIHVAEGMCQSADGTLAGSDLNMAAAVRNTVSMLGVDLAEAARMAALYPAEFLGLAHEYGRIAPGYRANLILSDKFVNVTESWIDGRDTGCLHQSQQRSMYMPKASQ
ncbi:MAG: N-acetylglucosamine-6-phosphate deacetylase [Asticcacaulis sp.]